MVRIDWKRAIGIGAVAASLLTGGVRAAQAPSVPGEPSAVPKAVGIAAPNALFAGLLETPAAQGSTPLENPTAVFRFYGYNGNGPMVPAPGDIQTPTHNVEASKTEPDKNTYLVLENQRGADPGYDYGTHFLFQGHETGVAGYVTRINLDADALHRVTLFASQDRNGHALPVFDGSTWDPWAQRLLFTAENLTSGGVWQATLDYPSVVDDMAGVLGRGGYEGIQNDSDGNLWILEDVGGATGAVAAPHAKQPNSFLYRFLPKDRSDLTRGGKLQALQVKSLRNGQPIVFHAGQADADILSQDQADLHTYGRKFDTKWITLHDTDADGFTSFNANALAKSKLATPFKRPENGQFRPGQNFKQFFFDATGDTDSRTEAGSSFGGFGAIFQLTQSDPSASNGKLTLLFRGDLAHTGLDNCAFWDRDHVVFVEDGGDTLHTQRNAFDSAYLFDVRADYGQGARPIRVIALGRDSSATLDSGYVAAGNGFQNEGDNEITGFHVSDGNPGPDGILGAQKPEPFKDGWRVFYTQQHGDNVTWEIVASDPGASSPLFNGSN